MHSADARALLSAAAVRNTARRLLELARSSGLADWRVDMDRLPATADFVAAVIRERYPRLDPSWHSRWRHFVFGGVDLYKQFSAAQRFEHPQSRARLEVALVILSVLLDAGAGAQWHYRDAATGMDIGRSEGLALASLRWFMSGGISGDPARLQRLDAATLEQAFQVSSNNPLTGAAQRAALLNRLGATIEALPQFFGGRAGPHLGGLFDALAQRAVDHKIPAAQILDVLLQALAPIWLNRPVLDGVALGDCWPHPELGGATAAASHVPLHKLSQWLAYSLIEPLQTGGYAVTDLDALTGLAEYRNGGLFVDLGVLVPRDPAALTRSYQVADAFVVGWRSLTVALLDELAPLVRTRLGVSARDFPLAKLLEGGTWAAGRKSARERRADGGPPFHIISDGTVF